MKLTKTEMAEFEDNGFIIIRNLLNKKEIEKIHKVKEEMSEIAKEHTVDFKQNNAGFNLEPADAINVLGERKGIKGKLRKVQEIFPEVEEFRNVCASDKVLDVVESIIGPEIYYHSSKLMCKQANGGIAKGWHQDRAYWSDMESNQVTVWYAIDPSTKENGCIQVKSGSHKFGILKHVNKGDFIIEDEVNAEDIFFAEMQPGDVLFFNTDLLHASAPNNTSKNRLACIVDFHDRSIAMNGSDFGSKEPIRSAKKDIALV